jgi:hypothetical protein
MERPSRKGRPFVFPLRLFRKRVISVGSLAIVAKRRRQPFFRWRREAAGQVTRAFVDGASDLAGRHVGRAALPQVAAGAVLLARAITDEAILTDIAAGLHKMRLRGRRRLSGDLVDGEFTFA